MHRRADIALKAVHQAIATEWRKQWAAEKRPLELMHPAFQTLLKREFSYRPDVVLNGLLPNYLTDFGSDRAGEHLEAPPGKRYGPTILERGCGLHSDLYSDILMARTAAFASQNSREEARAVAFSAFTHVVKSDDGDGRFVPAMTVPEAVPLVREMLLGIMSEDAEDFLLHLIRASLPGTSLPSGRHAVYSMMFFEFWRDYANTQF